MEVLEIQKKNCGHFCYPSITIDCCTCMDTRPILPENNYPMYIDGVGWSNTASRNAGYCHICNPKNYDEWNKKLRIQSDLKIMKKQLEDAKRELDSKAIELDRQRAIEMENIKDNLFVYSNGDQYFGSLRLGLKHDDYGKMEFHDGTTYIGSWKDDLMEGYGERQWHDGISYTGYWKNNKMHGYGKYTMADGTILEGIFENDEFVE